VKQAKGFTLIELLVAVAIVGILTAVAVASYQEYVARSARADAKAVLMEAVGWMERNYTLTTRYNQAPNGDAIATPPITQSPKTGTARYNITFSAISAQGYTLQAAPTGAQTGDACGNLTLTNTNAMGAGGSVADCWQR